MHAPSISSDGNCKAKTHLKDPTGEILLHNSVNHMKVTLRA